MEREVLNRKLHRHAVLGSGLLVAGCGSVATDECIGQHHAPIVSGRRATEAELYSTVAITDPSGATECSGTLIAPRLVVTAAHCVVIEAEPGAVPVELPASIFRVVEGARDVSEALPEQIHRVSSITRHPSFSPDAFALDGLSDANDIATMVLTTDASFLQPARMLTTDELSLVLRVEGSLTIAGYGHSDPDGDASGLLMLAETPYVAGSDTEFMAGRLGEPDTCSGDSGGPAYALAGGVRRLLGITSRGASRDSACGAGTVFTLVAAYAEWLLSQEAPLPRPPLAAVASSRCWGSPPEAR
jgi:secreted trypsin-like serine protease